MGRSSVRGRLGGREGEKVGGPDEIEHRDVRRAIAAHSELNSWPHLAIPSLLKLEQA